MGGYSLSLEKYHRKRNFGVTKEPFGKKKSTKRSKLIYVIQKHAASHLHYDFRLELDGVLISWAVPKGPSLDPKVKHLAMHVEDHPIEYAKFEGIIPKGEYGGGTVMIWDEGTWEPLDENARAAYHKGHMTFELHGKKLKGVWKLIRIRGKDDKGKDPWLLFKVEDKYSKDEDEYDIKKEKPYSATTKRSLEEISGEKKRVWTREGEIKQSKKKLSVKRTRLTLDLSKTKGAKKKSIPLFINPELATLVTDAPAGEKWLHEIKWDGYRLLARIHNGEVMLLTRHNKDWTYQFPSLVRALKSLKFKDIILDGEVVALDKNKKTNFQILQNSMEDLNLDIELIYYVFDIQYYDNCLLLDVPLIERKRILEKILNSKKETPVVRYNDHIVGSGDAVFKNACKYSLEGIVSKKIDSRYSPRRTKDWLKVKCVRRQEFVIAGYTDPKSSRKYFGALLLGYYDKNKNLIYCGRVGTGFSHQSLKEISEILFKYKTDAMPFESFPERVTKSIHWLKPKMVAEIEYLEMTDEGILRHPSFKGLREDKNSKSISLELPKEVAETNMKTKSKKRDDTPPKKSKHTETIFTNLDRVLYPGQGITKGDLVEYYESVADWIMPHIKNRPLTLVRCPAGNHKKCFYQKHMNENVPKEIKSIPILEHGKYEPYICINNLQGLMGLVQMGVLEIHPWGSNNKDVEKPDRLIFDLDPAPDVGWKEVIDTAFKLHEFFDYLNLKNFVKTTGGKGLHVVIPIKPTLYWDEIRDITKRIADLMVEINPTKYIATMSKSKRTGKIFIDYLRNSRGATAVAAYSTRARDHAPVAVPLSWEELTTKIKPNGFTIENINERLNKLKSDPWEEFFKTKQSITGKIKKELGFR